jgi:hypothetical protein
MTIEITPEFFFPRNRKRHQTDEISEKSIHMEDVNAQQYFSAVIKGVEEGTHLI